MGDASVATRSWRHVVALLTIHRDVPDGDEQDRAKVSYISTLSDPNRFELGGGLPPE
jgi:hypothetical protein